MISLIKRELRAKRMRSAKKWRKAQEKKRRLQRKLGVIEEQLKADVTLNCDGILIAIHHLRGPYGKVEHRFEFYRKQRRGTATDLGVDDLAALILAAKAAQQYRAKHTQVVGLETIETSAFVRAMARFMSPAHRGNQNGEQRVGLRLINKK